MEGMEAVGDRKRLEDIENQAMVEEDPEKLANLCARSTGGVPQRAGS